VCARDVALELLRRELGDVVRRIEREHHAPVVLEFAGPSARLLSVSERSVLCGIAPQLGAAAALFVSDEKTEVFLRDQRRSKAHRALVPDPGAPCDEVVTLDLATVDPLLQDEAGVVRPVRDLAGQPVAQVLLGGDSGVTLRDILAVAMLLKSKRVPPRLDFLIAPPSRQVLEVLAQSGGLVDLVATGARILEPDHRVVTGQLYPPPPGGLSLRTADPEPRVAGNPSYVVTSAETLALAVSTGVVGDPRAFKRPVRVTVPRVLPTDDVLVLREKKSDTASARKAMATPATTSWRGALTLEVLTGLPNGHHAGADRPGLALVLSTLDEVRAAAETAGDSGSLVRAVVAPFMPSGAVAAFASEGIAAFAVEAPQLDQLKAHKSLALPAPAQWGETVLASFGDEQVEVAWLATGAERTWTHAGTARPTPKGAKG
jgi:aconitate hydratase